MKNYNDIPKDYFKNLADRALARASEEPEDVLPAFLEKLRANKQAGFVVPDGYFEGGTVANRVLAANGLPAKTKVFDLRKTMYWAGAAAAVVLLATATWMYNPSTTNHNIACEGDLLACVEQLSDKEVAHYINENIHEFDTEQLQENVPAKALDEESITNEELEAYLDENVILE